MKQFLFLAALLVTVSCSQKMVPQGSTLTNPNFKSEIKTNIQEYLVALNDSEWDDVLDLIYPKLFEVVPRASMKSAFEEMMASGMTTAYFFQDISEYSKIVNHEDEQFVLIDYSLKMDIGIAEEDAKDPDLIEFMKMGFHNQFGEENTEYVAETYTFKVKGTRSMFAIAAANSSDWKFIENRTDQKALVEKLIPEAVRNQFN